VIYKTAAALSTAEQKTPTETVGVVAAGSALAGKKC